MVQLGGNEPLDEGGPGMAMVLFDGGDFTNDTLAQRAVTLVTSTYSTSTPLMLLPGTFGSSCW